MQAGARREEIVGFSGDLLRIAVQAPPVGGAANRALIRLLARSFGTSRSRVRVVHGEKSKTKMVELMDLTPEALKRQLDTLLPNAQQDGEGES